MSSVIVSSTDLDSFLHQGHGIYHIGISESLEIPNDGQTYYFRTGLEIKLPDQHSALVTPLIDCFRRNVLLQSFVIDHQASNFPLLLPVLNLSGRPVFFARRSIVARLEIFVRNHPSVEIRLIRKRPSLEDTQVCGARTAKVMCQPYPMAGKSGHEDAVEVVENSGMQQQQQQQQQPHNAQPPVTYQPSQMQAASAPFNLPAHTHQSSQMQAMTQQQQQAPTATGNTTTVPQYRSQGKPPMRPPPQYPIQQQQQQQQQQPAADGILNSGIFPSLDTIDFSPLLP